MTGRRRRSRRRPRADGQRNVDALLEAAKSAFATSGVDAPAREIAKLAGVGVGTLYRHFPRRSDLIVAVLEHEIDACAEAGPALSAAHEPGEALTQVAPPVHGLRRDQARTRRGPALRRSRLRRAPRLLLGRLGPVLDASLRPRGRGGPLRHQRQGPAQRRRPSVPSGARREPRVQPADGGAPDRRTAPRLGCARGRPIERQRVRSNSSATARMCVSTAVEQVADAGGEPRAGAGDDREGVVERRAEGRGRQPGRVVRRARVGARAGTCRRARRRRAAARSPSARPRPCGRRRTPEGLRPFGELAADRVVVGGLGVVEDQRGGGELLDRRRLVGCVRGRR